jgi:hypothetical protein
MSSSTAGSRGERALEIVCIAYTIAVGVFALHVVQRSMDERYTVLIADDYANLAMHAEKPFLPWLFAPHNGHLIPATRLLLHLDYEHLTGRGSLPVFVSFLCTGVSIVLLYAILGMSRPADPMLRRTLAAFFGFCLLWSGVYYGYLWGFSVHVTMTTAWLAASLACLIALAAREEGAGSSRRPALVLLAAAGGFGASLSCATGVAAWGALFAVALAARLGWSATLTIVAGGCLSVAVYAAANAGQVSTAELLGQSLSDPAQLLTFIFTFLGSFVGWTVDGLLQLGEPVRDRVSVAAGAVGMLGLLAFGVRSLRASGGTDAPGLLGLGLMGYGATAGILAGLGRSFAFGGVSARFAPFAALFWMGAVAALVSAMRGTPHSARARMLFLVLLPVVSLSMLPALDAIVDVHRRIQRETANVALMVLVGVRNEDVLGGLSFGDAEMVTSLLPELERDGRGPFAEPRRALLGRPLSEAHPAAERARCPGKVSIWKEIESEGAPGAMITGFAPETADSPPDSILVTDARGTIRGLGDVLPNRGEPRRRWRAFLGPHPPDQRYDVYAVLEDGSVCLIRGLKSRARRGQERP